jgi:hypothetical protein
MANNKANFGETTLGATILDDDDTAITVTSGTPFPVVPFLVTIGTEILKCTDKGAGTNWTVTRGEQSSVAAAHDNGTTVQNNITAGDFSPLVEGPASATDNAIVRFDATTGKLVQDYTSNAPTISDTGNLTLGTTARIQTVIEATDTAALGDEKCLNGTFATNDFTSWTAGANWSAATGVAVATASAGTLTQVIALTTGKTYQLSFVMTRSAGTLTVTFPAMVGSNAYTSAGTRYFTFVCTSTTDYTLTFTPNGTFAGSVDTVSVKEVSGTNDGLLKIFNVDGSNGIELRSGGNAAGNVFIGYQAGYKRTQGVYNVGIGYQTQVALTVGNWNVAVGYQAQNALTCGVSNFAMGGKAQYILTTGNYNIGMGILALGALVTGSDNIAIGYAAGDSLTTGSDNTFIGYIAGLSGSQKVDATNSMALGANTYTTANNQVVIGDGNVTEIWMALDKGATVIAGKYQLGALNTAPANATDTGTLGEIRVVNGFIYVCVATNSWQRAAIAAW